MQEQVAGEQRRLIATGACAHFQDDADARPWGPWAGERCAPPWRGCRARPPDAPPRSGRDRASPGPPACRGRRQIPLGGPQRTHLLHDRGEIGKLAPEAHKFLASAAPAASFASTSAWRATTGPAWRWADQCSSRGRARPPQQRHTEGERTRRSEAMWVRTDIQQDEGGQSEPMAAAEDRPRPSPRARARAAGRSSRQTSIKSARARPPRRRADPAAAGARQTGRAHIQLQQRGLHRPHRRRDSDSER